MIEGGEGHGQRGHRSAGEGAVGDSDHRDLFVSSKGEKRDHTLFFVFAPRDEPSSHHSLSSPATSSRSIRVRQVLFLFSVSSSSTTSRGEVWGGGVPEDVGHEEDEFLPGVSV